jgi:SAM-dependent methyltransferase
MRGPERSRARPATFNAKWDDRPAEYSTTRDCWLSERRALFVNDFLAESPPGARVLELGSGTGDLLIALARQRPDLRFTGVEPQQSYVDFARGAAAGRGIANVSFEAGRAEDLASVFSRQERFDRILSNDVLHHIPESKDVLRAAASVAYAATRWLAIEPNWRNPYAFLRATLRRGERNFWPSPFLREARALGWSSRGRSYLFLVPPFVKKPPGFFIRLERALEHRSLLAGGVALTLTRD